MHTHLIDRIKYITSYNIQKKVQLIFVILFYIAFTGWCFVYSWNGHLDSVKISTTFLVLTLIYILTVIIPVSRVLFIKTWMVMGTIISYLLTIIITAVIYFLFLTPVFYVRNKFNKKNKKMNSYWITDLYVNDDYTKMG